MAYVLVIANWGEYQHYKDRDPPWVKLYRDTMTSEVWTTGTDLSRLIQVASMMLAARNKNRIPLNFEHLKKVCHFDCDETSFLAAVDHLLAHNFLEIQEVADSAPQSASRLLARRNTNSKVLYSEERRGEERRAEIPVGETNRSDESVPRGTAAQHPDSIGSQTAAVFRHWCITWNHPRGVLDGKRRRLIRNALGLYSVQQLMDAISGYRNSPHHMGQNERNTVYDDIGLFLRDAAHIDAGLAFHHQSPDQRQAQDAEARHARQVEEAWATQRKRAAGWFREPEEGESLDVYRDAINTRIAEQEALRRAGVTPLVRTA